jgi:hypothetical protein
MARLSPRLETVSRLLVLLGAFGIPSVAAGQAVDNAVLSRVCRAAIAVVMGRDVAIIGVVKIEDGIAYTSYTRPSDSSVWKNRCKIEGDRIVWGTVDAFGPGSGFGPWRVRPDDERVTFSIRGPDITITEVYADGSRSQKSLAVK